MRPRVEPTCERSEAAEVRPNPQVVELSDANEAARETQAELICKRRKQSHK